MKRRAPPPSRADDWEQAAREGRLPCSRETAMERGTLVYWGAPCERGHFGTRYTDSDVCIQCAKETNIERNALRRHLVRKLDGPLLNHRRADDRKADRALANELKEVWDE